MPRTRIDSPRDRQMLILSAAAKLFREHGYDHVTRERVAVAAGVAPALITHHFGTMVAFRRALMRYAVQHEILPIVAHGIVTRHPAAMKAPEELRRRAAEHIANHT